MTGEKYRWQKLDKNNIEAADLLLRKNENKYVSACARFLKCLTLNDPVWALIKNNSSIEALIINLKSALMPVLFGKEEIPPPKFLGGFFNKKKIHSIQGQKNEVLLLENILKQAGMKVKDFYDYDLMSLDVQPVLNGVLSNTPAIELKIPQLTDLDKLAPIQAEYEKEEVLPAGSIFNPSVSRLNIANITANGQILTAWLDNKLIGKINVSAVSYTRFQVGGVYVHPDYRGRGIARWMAHKFISSLINQGKGVTLFVKKNNTAARRLYTSLGFTVNGDFRITYY
ncbi:MAG: GNAT family N-acetyltransferase [Treponema sp.]|nr:GNAT family N-acetyltransferase [Treponema sp.]